MIHIHKCCVVFHIGAEEGGQTCTARIDIEPPVLLGRGVGVACVGEVGVFKIVLCVAVEGKSRLRESLWKAGQRNRRLFLRRIHDLKIVDETHSGNLAECLIDDRGEHPPCAILVLPQKRKELFAVECEGDPLSLLCEPDGDILHLYAVVVRTQGKAKRGCAPDADVPVLAHGGGSETCEIDERKKLGADTLGREDQLIFRAALSELERDIIKGNAQNLLHMRNQLLTAIRIAVHQRTQIRLCLRKGCPCLLHAGAERALKERQGKTFVTTLDHTLGIRIAGERGKSLLEVGEGAVFAVKVVVGIAHAEVPEVIALEMLCVRREEGDRLFKICAILYTRRIVVGACKLAVEFRRALLSGQRLDLCDDFLILFVFVPALALFE